MRSFRFAAMGSEAHVVLPSERADLITAVRELFADWEARLSRFLPESELSRLNARAGERVVVSRLLFDAIRAAVAAAGTTDGIFDPTLLPQLRRIGYAQPFDRMQAVPAPETAATSGGAWRGILLDPDSPTVLLPHGCGLDLGGIAKGMTADAAVDLLGARGVEAALVSAGGDLRVRGLPPGSRAWQVLVGDGDTGHVVPLVRGALATSGRTRRAWLQGGLHRHHLLDPRTGEPAESSLREVTVASSTCARAEVAATAAFALGPVLGAEFLAARRLAGRFVHDDGTISSVGRWPRTVSAAA